MVKLNCKCLGTKPNLHQSSVWVGGICPTHRLAFQGNFNLLCLFFFNLLCKTTMPFFSRGSWFDCLILPLVQFMSTCPLQTCYVLQDIYYTEVALGVQFIRFPDGWGNSKLKWTTLHTIFNSICDGWWCSKLRRIIHVATKVHAILWGFVVLAWRMCDTIELV